MGRVFLSNLRYTWRKELPFHFVVQETGSESFNNSSKVTVPVPDRTGNQFGWFVLLLSLPLQPFHETGPLGMPSSWLPVALLLASLARGVLAS